MNRIYACIDLKSFYASVECKERNLDPLTTNLVVADSDRTEKTICLAVSPSLKSYGIPGRARLFEVVQKVKEVNYERKKKNKYKEFISSSFNDIELKKNTNLKLDYIVAPPRMKYYMEYSTNIYNVYLKYLSPDDIYVYSIDEVFCDITNYLNTYKLSPRELITKIIHDVYKTTGITATAGIGTNLYLAKVAMDIVAKHTGADKYGVRIAGLDEMTYRRKLWNHKPLIDFWRIGKGISKKLEENNMYTMGDIARCSINNEDLLYNLFGVNAELIIDHAWGWEPCTMKYIKEYKPTTNSISSGQVLHEPYNYTKAKIIIREMIDLLSLELVEKKLETNQLVLTVGYDIECLTKSEIRKYYDGQIVTDFYGRKVPKPAHGTINLKYQTSSSKILTQAISELYDQIVNKKLLIRRINISANNLIKENKIKDKKIIKQIDLFTNYDEFEKEREKELIELETENKIQNTIIDIKNKYGKNAILKGMNLIEGATTKERNEQIGGHRG
ncbi:MAG: DNA methylase [Bacilli bacterium]|nr:DNA methylase [Bacilli bacterium]